MKRILALLLCALMLAACPAGALAADGDLLLHCGTEGDVIINSIQSACAVGDTLYLLDYEGGLYTLAPGDAAPSACAVSGFPEAEDSEYLMNYLLSDGAQPMLLTERASADGDTTLALYAIAVEGGAARAEKVADVDPGTNEFSGFRDFVSLGEHALLRCYDGGGNAALASLRLSDGAFQPVAFDAGEPYALAVYTEGRALIEVYDYEQPTAVRFFACNPVTGAVEELAQMTVEEYSPLGAIACDPATGAAYCVVDGELHALDLEAGALGEAIASAPVDGAASTWILPSGYFAAVDHNLCLLRSLSAGAEPMRRMVICDTSYENAVERSYFDFQSAHGEVSAVLQRDGSADIIERMMARDASVDVYVLSSSSAEFSAIRDRGYALDLTRSPALAALAERMRPGLREGLSAGGALAALPVSVCFWQARVNPLALEKFGQTVEDVPTDWSGFLDYLRALQERFPQDGSVTLLEPYNSAANARRQIFDLLFDAYQQALARDPDSVRAQDMVELITKLEQIDFTRLGQPAEVPEDFDYTYDPSRVLLTTNVGTSLSSVMDEGVPLAMSLSADAPVQLPVECSVAFVNPYSENADLAVAYMEQLAQALSNDVLYTFCGDLTEPVPNPTYEESVRSAEEGLANAQARYDAAEPIDRQALESELEFARRYLEQAKEQRYSIGEQEIAWLGAHGDELVLQGENWLYSDGAGDAYELINQYHDGKIDAARLMKQIDNKLRMMILEGR